MLLLTGTSASLPQIPKPWKFTLVITRASHLTFFVLSGTRGNSWHYRSLISKAGGSLKQQAPGGSKRAIVPIPFVSARAWRRGTAWWWWWCGARGWGPWISSYCLWREIQGHSPRSRSLFPISPHPPSCCHAFVPDAASASTPPSLVQQMPRLGMHLLCWKACLQFLWLLLSTRFLFWMNSKYVSELCCLILIEYFIYNIQYTSPQKDLDDSKQAAPLQRYRATEAI